jgi:transcriptional regulator with XRE-family HTH domain
MIVAYHLKELRLEHGYTQEYVAFELDVSQKTYSSKENGKGKITVKDLLNLSKIYDIDPLELFAKLVESTPQLTEKIQKDNKSLSTYNIHHGVNDKLALELLKTYQARITDLEKLVKLKEEKIARLENEKKT